MEPEATLKDWIQQHHVTWELGTWQEQVDHHVTTVGFELRLFGQHGPHVHASPGCGECVPLYERLRAIALAAFPNEHRPTQYVIEPFHPALHMRPESAWAPEVQLTVHIVHRSGYLRPLDECERRCAEEIQKALRRLGVQAKSWSEMRTAAGPAAV